MVKEIKEEEREGNPICPECQAVMEESETGEWYCPECAGKIDYFGDDEEDGEDS